MRETESSPAFVTQTESLSAATALGDAPTGIEAAIRPDPESIAPTESAPTPSSEVSPEPPPSAKTGIATAAAITPTSAAASSERRRRGACLTSSAPRSGGNSTRSPSATTCEIRSGRSTSFRRYEPRSRRKTPGGRSSSTSSRVEDDSSTCPPWPTRADPGGAMHREADVALARRGGLARVDADPHAARLTPSGQS